MSDFTLFLYARRYEILQQTWQHLNLTIAAVLPAALIGIVIGIWLTRQKKWSASVLGFLGILQTIPSLALLGFMLPLLGIGALPAIIALFLYALLPIARNTFTGVEEVSPQVKEAAKGMGLSSWQVLWQVELPLAMPVIFAGVRTAVVISVGVATLCALIAAGGLGEFIFRGIALNNSYMILAGALPAACLALLLDFMLVLVQKRIYQLRPFLGVSVGLILAFAIWSWLDIGRTNQVQLTIGLTSEFMERPDGYHALKETYDLHNLQISEMDAGLTYDALRKGKVDIVSGAGTDGRIAAYNLRVLQDDKYFFPPYYVAPYVNAKTLQKYPQIRQVLNRVAPLLSDSVMRALNYEIDKKRRNPRQIAKDFLAANNFRISTKRRGNADLVIGSKNFGEQYILAEMFKLLIENYTDLSVSLKKGLGGTKICFEALRNGEIDLYPEYTGTAFLVMHQADKATQKRLIKDKNAVYEYVKKKSLEDFNLVWLKPFGFNNSYVLMMREEQAKQLNIESISDLSRYLRPSNTE